MIARPAAPALRQNESMPAIFIYAATGRFNRGEFEWNSPPPGETHDFMLFMRQAADVPMERAALAAIRRFGFENVQFMSEGRPIDTEALNTPGLAPFRKNYEDAWAAGSSLAWYR
jgi:hypothetical protein